MIRQELPGLLGHVTSVQPLRPKPRWFLYDPDATQSSSPAVSVQHERALVSEWAVRLSTLQLPTPHKNTRKSL